MTILQIILLIIIVEFIVNKSVGYLNLKHELKPINTILSDKFSYSKRKRSHYYHLVNYRVSAYSSMVALIVVAAMFLFAGFGSTDYAVRQCFENAIVVGLVFMVIILLGGTILELPWNIYDVFYIESRFGFNKQSFSSFILDKIKGGMLALVFGGAIFGVVSWIYYSFPSDFWWMAWVVITAFSLFLTMFYSSLIVPMFNKQTPLEDGELRNKIEMLAQKVGFRLQNIFVIDGSKRSTKANAYFTGLGAKKRIVLYDTLIKQLSVDEVVAVLAHEVGHYKKKHVVWNLLLSIFQTGLVLFVFHLVLSFEVIYTSLGAVTPSFHLGLLVFSFLFSPVSSILGVFTNYLSRQFEYQADAFASDLGFVKELQFALIELSDLNLSNINPHPLFVFLNYSHPPINDRLRLLQS